MRIVYFLTLLSSLFLAGCASFDFNFKSNQSPILRHLSESTPYQVVQVPADFATSVVREHPYFVVCADSDCTVLTPKTPIRTMPIKVSSITPKKGRKASMENTAYMKRTPTSLESFRVHFDYASTAITDTYHKLLQSFVDDYPHKQTRLRVTGYTDSGSKSSGNIGNQWLALERATSVKNHLITLGYPGTQILLEAKSLCCYIDSNKSEAGRQNNRRAEITLITHETKNGDSPL